MILYNRKKVKYRKDGYCWKKRKDGKTTREDHMKLKVQGVEVKSCLVPHMSFSGGAEPGMASKGLRAAGRLCRAELCLPRPCLCSVPLPSDPAVSVRIFLETGFHESAPVSREWLVLCGSGLARFP